MRLVVYVPQRRVGLVHEDRVIDICTAYATYLAERTGEPFPQQQAALTVPAELGAFIAAGERALSGAQDAVTHLTARGSESGLLGEPLSWPLPAVTLHPPLAARARMFLAGNNYPGHAAGAEGNPDADPAAVERVRQEVRSVGLRGFISFPETCVGPEEGIIHPARTDMLDFEGEIAVVVGDKCKDVAAADAHELFCGFFLLNDVSARRAVPVADNPRSRFARDKNFDASKCAGPYIVVNEFADAQDIRWETRVNGEIRQRVRRGLQNATFIDATELVDQIKVIKSEEERQLIRAAAALQDGAMQTVFEAVRPGVRERDVVAAAVRWSISQGSDYGTYMIGSAQPAEAAHFYPPHLQDKIIEKGDVVSVLIENSGPGGYYAELGRTCVVGSARPELLEELEFARAAQRACLELLKPGARCADIWEAYNDFMREHGRPEEARIHCHGQGYDLVERPLVRFDETMTIEQDMNITCHPAYDYRNTWSWICDNYLIGDGGPGESLHRTPQQIFEL